MAEIVVKNGIDDIEFFGEIDKTFDRDTHEQRVASEYPAWYFDRQCRNIKDEISAIEGRLERGEVPEKGKMAEMKLLRQLKQKKDAIEKSTLRLNDVDKDKFAKTVKDLAVRIGSAKFSRSDEQKGFADAHEEYERQNFPCIELKGDEFIFARKANVQIVDGKVSRNGAEKIWKIMRKALGESSDTAILQRA